MTAKSKPDERPSGRRTLLATAIATALLMPTLTTAQNINELKESAMAQVDQRAKLVQEMVDSIFAFAEPGFQEFETSAYLTGILDANGFEIVEGISGIPTAWTATWRHGVGGPKIALGSDIDGLLGLSQKPGVATIEPLIPGAPGHGEGHNSGMPAMVAAALAVQEIMVRQNIPGELMLWPGVAEELLATKAFYVRDGVFADVDANIFTHVSRNLGTSWGPSGASGLVSVEYSFAGSTSHAAGAPWAGRSSLDAVEIMNIAWNMRREHLPLSHRSHYVITNGGGQPNIVPGEASVWYYFRDTSFEGIRQLFEIGNTISEAAAMASGTEVSRRVLGYAAPMHGNRPMAEAAHKNFQLVGLPEWSEDDIAFARAIKRESTTSFVPYMAAGSNDDDDIILATEIPPLREPRPQASSLGGPSDDIGDVMWTVPTITISYPSNVPNTTTHHVTAAMAMATPIAHKGAVAGAKAVALTVLDLMTDTELLAAAKDYFHNEQLQGMSYDPVLTENDQPAIHLNKEIMDQMRPLMREYYYDPSRFDSYLEQLGVEYPPQ
ncbi:MAG: peptidase dimerization domain-containing protein [Pseudohongiella sp.]|uniref:peptidase dimerization domain-containing protein n=1 Tax=Pseudohongiella sp. TaxID=1979412 RepID=UPI0034A00443